MRELALVALLAIAAPARATGPSQATVRIVPVAVSAKGVVLFKTWRELNPEGAHAAVPAEFAWLAVDAEGLWREVPHAAVGPEVARDDAPYYRLLKEFRAAFDWKNPPATVRPLLAELGVTEQDRVPPDLGQGKATWTPQKLCAGAKCAEGVMQWAPGGIVSEEGKGSPITASFFCAGVALFHREPKHEDDLGTKEPPGASFRLPPIRRWDPTFGFVDVGYDLQVIDAISIVPKALR